MTQAPAEPAGTGRVLGALLLVYVIWGSIFLGIRIIVDEGAPPLWAMSVRFLGAAMLLGLYLVLRGGTRRLRVSVRELAGAVLMGVLLLALGNGLTALGILEGVTSGGTALLVASTPMWIALFRTFDGDRPSPLALAGVALGALGLVQLVASGRVELDSAFPLGGTVVVLVATLAWAGGSYVQPRVTLPQENLVGVLYQLLTAGVFLALGSLLRAEQQTVHFTAVSWLAMAFLAVLGSLVAFSAYSWLLRTAPISLVSTQAYVNPLIAVGLGWLILDEPVTAAMLVGSSLILASVLMLLYAERSPRVGRVPVTSPGP
jgi:drug/metabolite transporter (DMT)-like permease